MKRVLQVLGSLDIGGAESRIMDLYRHIDRDRLQFDFLVTDNKGKKYYFEDEIRNMGGNIYFMPPFRVYNYLQYAKGVRTFFDTHRDYAAVHGHMTSTAAIYLREAAAHGIRPAMAHARSAGVDAGIKGLATKVLRWNLYNKCDRALACSSEAGRAVFGEKADFRVIPNAVDTDSFVFNMADREKIRSKHNLGDKIIIGHVGSFRYAKNHDFILDVALEIQNVLKDNKDWKLLLLGDGELRSTMEERARTLGIDGNVMFLGNINPPTAYYSAFDVLLFPSRYEGMPGTVVEAQANGLGCVLSDCITEEVKCTDRVSFMSLQLSPLEWAERCIETAYKRREEIKTGEVYITNMKNTMFDVNTQVEFYYRLYDSSID